MSFIDRTARSFLLAELVSGMALTLKYMFKPKVTINYPYEKGPLSPVSVANTHCAVTRTAKSVASPANFAKPFARHRPSPLRSSRAMTVRVVPRVTTLI